MKKQGDPVALLGGRVIRGIKSRIQAFEILDKLSAAMLLNLIVNWLQYLKIPFMRSGIMLYIPVIRGFGRKYVLSEKSVKPQSNFTHRQMYFYAVVTFFRDF